MELSIYHQTDYIYSSAVFLEPHLLRIKPRTSHYLRTLQFGIDINPEPAGSSESLDEDNNPILQCWFKGQHRSLTIKSRAVIQAEEYDPFRFLVHPPEYLILPFSYSSRTRANLHTALAMGGIGRDVQKFLSEVLNDAERQTVPFLTALTKRISNEFVMETRDSGTPYDPDHTFNLRRGSCRDLAWMMIHMLRNTGIAARFVSGYHFVETDQPEYELHAWVEAYLPGAGWIGLDPGMGIMTAAHHVPLAASAMYENTMPVTGSIRGNARAKLENILEISRWKDD